MKIYTLPDEVPMPVFDYLKMSIDEIQDLESNHREDLKNHLISLGYDKPLTGEIYSEVVGDGRAMYMVADGGRNWGLVHLPYGDAYESQNVQFLPKSEIKNRINERKKFQKVITGLKKKKPLAY